MATYEVRTRTAPKIPPEAIPSDDRLSPALESAEKAWIQMLFPSTNINSGGSGSLIGSVTG